MIIPIMRTSDIGEASFSNTIRFACQVKLVVRRYDIDLPWSPPPPPPKKKKKKKKKKNNNIKLKYHYRNN